MENLLSKQKIYAVKSEENAVKGNFVDSNMYIVCEFLKEPRNFLAEINNKYENKIKTNITLFYVMKNYDQCCLETRTIIADLRAMSDVFFVFSFEYATVYAVNDRDGYRILGDGHMILDETDADR